MRMDTGFINVGSLTIPHLCVASGAEQSKLPAGSGASRVPAARLGVRQHRRGEQVSHEAALMIGSLSLRGLFTTWPSLTTTTLELACVDLISQCPTSNAVKKKREKHIKEQKYPKEEESPHHSNAKAEFRLHIGRRVDIRNQPPFDSQLPSRLLGARPTQMALTALSETLRSQHLNRREWKGPCPTLSGLERKGPPYPTRLASLLKTMAYLSLHVLRSSIEALLHKGDGGSCRSFARGQQKDFLTL